MGCKERDLPVQALYWWKSREVTRVPQAKRDAARSHVLWSLDCEQSLFGQSRLSSAGLPSLDVTDRRGTARSLSGALLR